MKAIVLAAGKGKRLLSEKYNIPKVLREANGRPLIKYVLDKTSFIPQKDTYIVVGFKKEIVEETITGDYNFVNQNEQLGTGHAVMVVEPYIGEYDGDVLVAYGDMPLFSENTYEMLIEKHKASNAGCTILTAVVDNPPDYGRVIRDYKGSIVDIVEKRDCSEEQLKINEVNVGMYVFNSRLLFQSLKQVSNSNAQGEYYLTDVPKVMLKNNIKIESVTIDKIYEIYGVNTTADLELCERILAEVAAERE